MSLPNTQLPSHTSCGRFRKARKFIKRSTSKKARQAWREAKDTLVPHIKGYTD